MIVVLWRQSASSGGGFAWLGCEKVFYKSTIWELLQLSFSFVFKPPNLAGVCFLFLMTGVTGVDQTHHSFFSKWISHKQDFESLSFTIKDSWMGVLILQIELQYPPLICHPVLISFHQVSQNLSFFSFINSQLGTPPRFLIRSHLFK